MRGSEVPSVWRPSMFMVGPPIIQSTWMRLSLAPRAASSSSGHVLAVDEAGGVGLAEGDVAGGVLVEEGVPEEDAGLGDGGVVGDESDFAEAGGAFVGGDELAQGVLATQWRWLR